MPRPYPGFQALKFMRTGPPQKPSLAEVEKVEIGIGPGIPASEMKKEYALEVEGIWFKKSNLMID